MSSFTQEKRAEINRCLNDYLTINPDATLGAVLNHVYEQTGAPITKNQLQGFLVECRTLFGLEYTVPDDGPPPRSRTQLKDVAEQLDRIEEMVNQLLQRD